MYAPYTLQEHFDTLEKEFHRLFLRLQEEPAGETIHKLRVNMKKQMAGFQLLRAIEPHLPLEEIQGPYAALFKSIGKIRNLEIRQTVLAETEKVHQIKEAYAPSLSAGIQLERNWWLEEENNISLVPFRQASGKVRTSVARMPLYNIRENLGEYFYFLIEEIRGIIHLENPTAEQLHDLRKFLKVFYYNIKLTDRLIVQETIPKVYLERLDAINDLLGEWHDQFITIYKLSAKRDKIDKRVLNPLRRKERATRKRIVGQFPALYDLTSELKKALFHLFAQDVPVKIPPRRFKENKYQAIRNSFSQANTLELIK